LGERGFLERKVRCVFIRYNLAFEDEKDLRVLLGFGLWCEFYFGVDTDFVKGSTVFVCEIDMQARGTLGTTVIEVLEAWELSILAPCYVLPLRRYGFIYIGSLGLCISIYLSRFEYISKIQLERSMKHSAFQVLRKRVEGIRRGE
jgi:hypothetical protein